MLKGLPASGKSTYAKELVAKSDKWKRVNKDELREMIDGGQWSKKNEEHIINVRDGLIKTWLIIGKCVVVDDTNLAPVHEARLREIAKEHNVVFEILNFDVPLMECIERDSKRGDKSVGAKVIQKMFDQYLLPKPPRWSENKQNAYIFDIDGTLAKMKGRSPYDYSKVHTDEPFYHVAQIARTLKATLPIIIVSGRTDDCKEQTMQWLATHNIPYDAIYMRKAGDERNDAIVKQEIYEEHIKEHYNVLAVFDDRNRVVDMWRSLGLTCLQVYYGYF